MENKRNSCLVFSTGKRKRVRAQHTNVYYVGGNCEVIEGQKEAEHFLLRSDVLGISYTYKGREYGLRVINHALRTSSKHLAI
jgi:hypothetical protein